MIADRLPKWKSFSLRTLFVLMTVCCLFIGAWSVYVNPYRRQQQSLAVVHRLQGSVAEKAVASSTWHRWLITSFLGKEAYTHVTMVDLDAHAVDDADLQSLNGLTHLEQLSLDRTQVTDAGLATLRAMPHLQVLSLRYTAVTDRSIPILAAAPELHTLGLTGTKVTDAATDELAKSPSLKTLFIRWTKITNDGASRLSTAMPKCAVFHFALQDE
jgi:hypothetical protein